ncbi:ser/Thr phosphatase family domain protein [Burkholderia pseudomallei]|nr:ser/Thr phosphatase family domain protein [Burkholderia pseudomallei]
MHRAAGRRFLRRCVRRAFRRGVPQGLPRCARRFARRCVGPARPVHLDQALEVQHHALARGDRLRQRRRVVAEQLEVGPERRAEHAKAPGRIDVDIVVQVVDVIERGGGVAHRRFERAEFAVVVFVVAGHVDDRHGRIERLRRPAQAFRVIVDVAREHDEIRLRVGDRLGLVAFEMQVGQHANFHGRLLDVAVRGVSAAPCRGSSG